MHLVCLCPTYGRPSLAGNALALFLAQALRGDDTADFVLFDDANQIDEQFELCADGRKRWVVFASDVWQPLPTKYPEMVRRHAAWSTGPAVDAYVIWDDDDVYLPHHLWGTSMALQTPGLAWSHPSVVLSTYSDRVPLPPVADRLHPEPSAGRFHGAAAVTPLCLAASGGWCTDDRADYDQIHLGRWSTVSRPADPSSLSQPSYVYRWADTHRNHCSGSIVRNQYQRPPIQEPGRVPVLSPAFDASTKQILARLAA